MINGINSIVNFKELQQKGDNMQKIKMLNRQGQFITMEWDYNPLNNPEAKKKAEDSLKSKGIIGKIYEVAPECFWYSTLTKKINCGLYI
jgi:hypothetical protein